MYKFVAMLSLTLYCNTTILAQELTDLDKEKVNKCNKLAEHENWEKFLNVCSNLENLHLDKSLYKQRVAWGTFDVYEKPKLNKKIEKLEAGIGNIYLTKLKLPKTDIQEGIEVCDNALKIKPDNVYVLRTKAVFLKTLDDIDAAISLYDHALRVEPDNVNTLRSKAMLVEAMGNKKEAMILYDHALRVEPDNVDTLLAKGIFLKEQGDTRGALSLYNHALRIEPSDVDTLRNKAVLVAQHMDERWGLSVYRHALRIEPDDVPTLVSYAISLARYDTDGAMSLYDRALRIEPDNINTIILKGIFLYRENKPREALPLFKQALELEPNNEEAKIGISLCNEKLHLVLKLSELLKSLKLL